jgi:hypothetical protein
MKEVKLTIDGDVQVFKVKELEDLTVRDWYNLHNALIMKESRPIPGAIGGGFEEIPDELASNEFLQRKYLKIVTSFCNIPEEYYKSYVGLLETILELIPDINNIDSVVYKSIKLDDDEYIISDLTKISFMEWCDIESYHVIDKLAPICIMLRLEGTSYDYFNNDLQYKLKCLYGLKAKKWMSTILSMFNEINKVRQSYYFVYNADYGSSEGYINNALKEHYKRFNWHDVIVQLTDSNAFNGPTGTLDAIRNAKALDVLWYLNIKRSREAAESKDQIANMNKIK